jgi:hypothetical protein
MKVDPKLNMTNIISNMDIDKDGKVSGKEFIVWVSNAANLKLILIVIISFLITPVIEFFQNGLTLNDWTFQGIMATFIQVIVPFTVVYYSRILMRPLDDELNLLRLTIKEKEKEIYDLKLEKILATQEYEAKISQIKLDNQLQLSQMEGALRCKDQEIEWREKGLIVQKQKNI